MTSGRGVFLASFLALSSLPATAAELPPAAKAIVAGIEASQTDKAVEAADQALKAAPVDAVTLLWAGRAYGLKALEASIFSKLSWAKKCREAWEKAAQLDPANLDVRRELIRYYVLVPGIFGGGHDKAEAQVARIAPIDPLKGNLARGLFYELTKRPVEAEMAYRKAVELDPDAAEPALALGNFLGGQRRWAEVRALIEKRLAAHPADATAFYQFGRFSSISGEDLEKGIVYLDRFLASHETPGGPSWADARWRKGLVFEKQGRVSEAIAEYRMALKLRPGHRGARRELRRLPSPDPLR